MNDSNTRNQIIPEPTSTDPSLSHDLEQQLRLELTQKDKEIKSQSHYIKHLERRDHRLMEQIETLEQENKELKQEIQALKKDGTAAARKLRLELSQTKEKLSEAQSSNMRLKAQLNPNVMQMHVENNRSLEQENAHLRKLARALGNFELKPGSAFPFDEAGQATFDFVKKVYGALSGNPEEVTIRGPLLDELKSECQLVLGAESVAKELSEESRKKIEELEEKKSGIDSERRSYNKEENKKIREIESSIKDSGYQELKEERSVKYRHDRECGEEIRRIDQEEEQIIEEDTQKAWTEVQEAVANTIREEQRKKDRSSETSSTPPSQQGLEKAEAPANEGQPKKRGAPKGHSGYHFEIDGIDLSGADMERLEKLAKTFPVEKVYLAPEDVPEGVPLTDKSTRIAFGMVTSPCILVYVQQEAAYKDPENKRRIIKKAGTYPSWLKKDFTYAPEYHSQAVRLKTGVKASFKSISDYFQESYGLTVSPKTVWNWIHEAAQNADKACEGIKNELLKEKALGVDETGFRDNGINTWVYATASENWSLFTHSGGRGFEGVEQNGVLLNALDGTIVIRDGYKVYEDERLSHLVPGRCWSHKVRSGRQAQEFEGVNIESLVKTEEWFLKALKIRKEAISEGKGALEPDVLGSLVDEFDEIVRQGVESSNPSKMLYKRKLRHLTIRKAMKDLLKSQSFYFNFLKGASPMPTPWNGTELSGRKNPQAILQLAEIANKIDLAVALANRDEACIPDKERERLEKEFFAQVRKTYNEFKDSKATVNFKTVPKIVEETTLVHNYFLDLQDHRDQFLLFLKNFNAEPTNNITETAIRPLKGYLKVSGSFRGYASDYTNLESYVSSARKQGLNLLEACEELVYGNTDYLFDKERKVQNSGFSRLNIKTAPSRKNA